MKVCLRESLSCQYFCAHSLRFLAKTRVPSWLRWRPYLSSWFSLMFGCLTSTLLFISSNLIKSMLFSFALCLSTLIVGADRTILTDDNISQIKLFNYLILPAFHQPSCVVHRLYQHEELSYLVVYVAMVPGTCFRKKADFYISFKRHFTFPQTRHN